MSKVCHIPKDATSLITLDRFDTHSIDEVKLSTKISIKLSIKLHVSIKISVLAQIFKVL